MDKNYTKLLDYLNETNHQSKASQRILNNYKGLSDRYRSIREKLGTELIDINKNLTDAKRNLGDLKQKLDSLTIDALNKDQQISNEQLRISKINNMISTNKDIADKTTRDNFPSELNRTEYELDNTKDKMDKVFNESERLLKQIKQNQKDIEAGKVKYFKYFKR